MNYLPYRGSVIYGRPLLSSKGIRPSHHIRQLSKGTMPALVVQSHKERKATSAYRSRVGQRAVEALTWRRRHHDIIVTSSVVSVVIGAPTLGGSSGVRRSSCLERYGVRSAIRTVYRRRSTCHKHAQSSAIGSGAAEVPGSSAVSGMSVNWWSEPVGRVEVVK